MNKSKLVIIDSSLDDKDEILNQFSSDAHIIYLSPDSDGFDQLLPELTENNQFSNVHIFTHGEAGSFELGSTSVNQSYLDNNTESLSQLKSHFAPGVDIHLYGCDVASTDNGQLFLENLATTLDADIAASDDLTGIDGDMELEFSTGELSTESVSDIELTTNLNVSWLGDITNSYFSDLIASYDDDNSFVYSEILDMIQQVVDGGITESEHADLKTFYSKTSNDNQFANDYLETVTYNTIYSNKGNDYWWGGVTDIDDRIDLGNMDAGMTEEKGDYLIGKWFLGTDTPMPVVGGDTANNSASSGVYSYSLATGDFWEANTPLANSQGEGDLIDEDDVNQGQAGTCYLLAAMGAIAHDDTSSYLTDAVTDNGNGTYGIRWYVDGETYYTTVDKQVITNTSGTKMVLTGNPDKALDGELWAALFERGYAQLNSQVKVGDNLEASIQAVEGGMADPLTHITGLDFTYYSASYNMGSGTKIFTQNDESFSTYKTEIINALTVDNSIGWIGAWGDHKVNGKQTVVSGHAQMLLDYNSDDDTFLMQNPWGAGESSSWIGTYWLKLEDFWNADVKPVIAISEKPDLTPKPTYQYEIVVQNSPVVEGDAVTFEIRRSDSNTETNAANGQYDIESSVYWSTLLTDTGDAADEYDFEQIDKKKVTFAKDSNTMTITLDTYEDNLGEALESFKLALYEEEKDTTPATSETVAIANKTAAEFNYTITTSNDTEANAATEGDSISFKISRDGDSERSVVYLSTVHGGTDNSDFEQLDNYAMVFEAGETEKTIDIVSSNDSSDEGVETFDLVLRESRGGSTITSKTAHITDYDAPSIEYSVITDAASESGAVAEGQRVDFTISRSVSGFTSSVFVKTVTKTAGSEDFEGINKTVEFAPNQKEATVSVWINKDLWLETSEYFALEVFNNENDEEPVATSTAFIENTPYDDYNYTLSTTTDDNGDDLPVTEGDNAKITITRSGTGNASTVYIRTAEGSAQGDDFKEMDRFAVEFAEHEASKTIDIKTFTDSVSDDNEAFQVQLLRNPSDDEATETLDITLADKTIEDYGYTLTTTGGGGSAENEFIEGDTVEYTITRDGGDSGNGSGTSSTIYLSTTGVTAGDADYVAADTVALTFAAHETTKTFTVETREDSRTEGSESFKLSLFKTESDAANNNALQTAEATLVDSSQASNQYTYELSAEKSVLEGEDYQFTIERGTTGSPSSVYVKTSFCNSDSSDFDVMALTKVNFGSVEEQKTISVATYNDNQIEGTECFWFEVYASKADAENYNSIARFRANIQDKLETPVYQYTVTSSTEDKPTEEAADPTAADEGTEITFNIKRELLNDDQAVDEGPSSIYINTTDGTAGSLDYEGLELNEIQFASAEDNEKSVTIQLNTDTAQETEEYFWLNLYETYADGLNQKTLDVAKGRIEHVDPTQAYSYTIEALENDNGDNAALEGDSIAFRISRERDVDYLEDTASTTYIGTWEGSAIEGLDYLAMDPTEIVFGKNETEKVITIETLRDTNTEQTEEFWLMQYDTAADAKTQNYEAYAAGYIKDDTNTDVLTYEMTTNAAEDQLSEGQQIEVTITRKGVDLNLSSTIYLESMTGNADGLDVEELELTKIEFAPNVESKTITLNTFVDYDSEGDEYFYIARYDNHTQATDKNAVDSTKVYIGDTDDNAQHYNYEIIMPADANGIHFFNEGYDIPVTIRRTQDTENLSTDVASTVYLSAIEGFADATDFDPITNMAVNFAADEQEKTINIRTFSDSEVELVPETLTIGVFKTYSDAVFTITDVWDTAFIQDDNTDHQFKIKNVALSSSATTEDVLDEDGNPVLDDNDQNITQSIMNFDTPTAIGDVPIIQSGESSYRTLAVEEGKTVKFTVERTIGSQDIGARMYVNTSGGYSTSDDYEALNAQEIWFEVGQSEVEVEFQVYRDSDSTEAEEYFWFETYNSYDDAYWGAQFTDYTRINIDNVALANDYTITSSTNNTDGGAAEEGDTITFTITRDGSEGEEEVYLRLYEGSAERTISQSYWEGDQGFSGAYNPSQFGDFIDDEGWPTTDPRVVTFADGETEKTITVDTIVDTKVEGIETFELLLFGDRWDAYFADISDEYSYVTKDVAHIRDQVTATEDGFTFTLSADSTNVNPTVEGDTMTFTVTRAGGPNNDGTGTASDIYLLADLLQARPEPGIADQGDIEWPFDPQPSFQKVSFAANATTATLTVNTLSDPGPEGLEELTMYLFDREYELSDNVFNQALTSTKGYITDPTSSATPPETGSTPPPLGTGTASDVDIALTDTGDGSASHPGHDGSLYTNKYAFAEIRDDGSVVAWGENDKGGDIESIQGQLVNVQSISATHGAFAAIKSDGSVIAWGDEDDGGDSSDVAARLNGNNAVVSIASTHSAFAARHEDGTVTVWGKNANGGNISSSVETRLNDTDNPVTELYSNSSAFVAVHQDGSLTTWGFSTFGGDSSGVASDIDGTVDVVAVESTHSSFAAVRSDGKVITWGNEYDGGDSSEVESSLNGDAYDVLKVWSNASSFAALLDNGAIKTWGDPTTGGDSSAVAELLDGSTNIKEVYASNNAFVALTENNTLVTWGDPDYGGGALPDTLDGKEVSTVIANEAAFAAILSDGSVVTWGQNAYGGDSSFVASSLDGTIDVTSIVASGNGFSAIRSDGSLVSWGGGLLEQEMTDIQNTLDGDIDVVKVIANDAAFAAIDANNNVYGWGNLEYGGNTNGVDLSESGNGIRLIVSGSAIQTRGGVILTGVEVLCDLVGADDVTVTTAADGSFEFDLDGDTDLSGASVTASLDTAGDALISSSIDLQDALACLNLAVGYGVTEDSTADSDDLIAADFNGDGVVNSQDALEIYEYSQGIGSGSNAAPDWLFVDTDVAGVSLDNVAFETAVAIAGANSDVNLMGILRGDIDASYGA
ncbi:Calx-beta domain-containing protein [uncultured Endozoicomonas sp.]|uniref:Calx-beta domain-containing protein n=1 Tax=uncultured Endozoicomonas sp. TaxID=432652 RepID=UPI0026150C18|nr:Calx-beta domain-containing protein [uncultured Endozoicomonas sp.]